MRKIWFQLGYFLIFLISTGWYCGKKDFTILDVYAQKLMGGRKESGIRYELNIKIATQNNSKKLCFTKLTANNTSFPFTINNSKMKSSYRYSKVYYWSNSILLII